MPRHQPTRSNTNQPRFGSDGVFRPDEPDVNQPHLGGALNKVRQLVDQGRPFLEHGSPNQDWVAVSTTRSLEQKNLRLSVSNLGSITARYLDELPPARPISLTWHSWVDYKRKRHWRALLPPFGRRSSKQFQRLVVQFIETVIVYQFPNWSRAEIERCCKSRT